MRVLTFVFVIIGQGLWCFAEDQRTDVFLLDLVESRTTDNLIKAVSTLMPARTSVSDVTVVAWSCKAEFDSRVPQLIDDVILLVSYGGQQRKWAFLSIRRIRGTDQLEKWVHNMQWLENSCGDAVSWIEHYADKPDASSLLAFTKKTNFGANEMFDRVRPLAVYLFQYKSKEVVAALGSGLDAAERSRRRDIFMKLNASPAD